jgi:type IV pilus assembly protein PilB
MMLLGKYSQWNTMEMRLQGVLQLLVQQKLLTEVKAHQYEMAARKASQRIIAYLVKNSVFKAKDIAINLAKYFNISFIDIDEFKTELNVENLISDELITKYNVLPLFQRDKQLFIVMDDPSQHNALQDLKFHTRLQVTPMVSETIKLAERINQHLYKKEHKDLEKYFNTLPDISIFEQNSLNIDPSFEDAPIVKLVNLIIQQAVKKTASDIHFEPYDSYYRIRFRQDGILYDATKPPANFAKRICARLKVMSNLDLSERRIPQDGRFSFHVSCQQFVDCRVSICPTINGEKIVIRLLNPDVETKPEIDALLMKERDRSCFIKALTTPQGLILVTGPTGSGKSMTLYAALNYLNAGAINISTVEDPVEIKLAGINQVQVNSKIGLDFANTLRSFLRQDPDVIMIGEIRDLETAEIAVKASQTGHLVLSTLHTNSSAETLIRLVNIGIPAFHLINTIKLIIAQRLIRKLCNNCKTVRYDINHKLLEELGYGGLPTSNSTFYKAAGCNNCTHGYRGRIALFEVMPMSEEIGKIIMFPEKKLSSIVHQAELDGMHTIKRSGFIYASSGVTSLEELHRVT